MLESFHDPSHPFNNAIPSEGTGVDGGTPSATAIFVPRAMLHDCECESLSGMTAPVMQERQLKVSAASMQTETKDPQQASMYLVLAVQLYPLLLLLQTARKLVTPRLSAF